MNIQPSSPVNQAIEAATVKPPTGMLENHPELTPTYGKVVYTDDYYTETELKGAINEAVLDVVHNANEDGKKNVVMLEANVHEGTVGVINYAANRTDEFKQGEGETIENVLSLQVVYVDEDGSDDNKQIRFDTQSGQMLANDPNLTPVRSHVFHLDDFDSKAAMKVAVSLEAVKVMQQAAADGKQNVVTVEANVKDGTMSVVNYEALDTSEYNEGDVIDMDGLLRIEIVSVDTDISDDAAQFILNLGD